jgi:hypothetical protein
MKPWKIIASAVVLGTLSSASIPPAVAAPLMPVAGSERLAASGQPVTEVQYRRGFRGPHHHHHHGYGHRRGVGAGAVIGGLAAGAIIGGAIASSQAQAQANQAASYCAQRYRSYDPASGTYLATDGYRRPCP